MGLGAQAAAAQHNDFDVAKLATWQAGSPIPFGFLANTYEAIAEESKRLVITRLLVRHVALSNGHDFCSVERLFLKRTAWTQGLECCSTTDCLTFETFCGQPCLPDALGHGDSLTVQHGASATRALCAEVSRGAVAACRSTPSAP